MNPAPPVTMIVMLFLLCVFTGVGVRSASYPGFRAFDRYMVY